LYNCSPIANKIMFKPTQLYLVTQCYPNSSFATHTATLPQIKLKARIITPGVNRDIKRSNGY
jgi:hypothetical protein